MTKGFELQQTIYLNPPRQDLRSKRDRLKKYCKEGWTFHKLQFKISKGASGQIRLMYLVNPTDCVIKLVWIYSHEQFAKRPADKDLKSVIKEILDL